MFVDPRDEFRIRSGEPPDDEDRRRTGPASEPSEEPEVTFLEEDDGDADSSLDGEVDADEAPRNSR